LLRVLRITKPWLRIRHLHHAAAATARMGIGLECRVIRNHNLCPTGRVQAAPDMTLLESHRSRASEARTRLHSRLRLRQREAAEAWQNKTCSEFQTGLPVGLVASSGQPRGARRWSVQSPRPNERKGKMTGQKPGLAPQGVNPTPEGNATARPCEHQSAV